MIRSSPPQESGDLADLVRLVVPDPSRVPVGQLSVSRTGSPFRTTSETEVITVSVAGEVVARVFCKSAVAGATGPDEWRFGLEYEAAVYRDLLVPAKAGVPHFYGTWTDPGTGRRHLAIALVEDAVRVGKDPRSAMMGPAATWLADFHSRMEARAVSPDLAAWVKVQDRAYFEAWFDRAGAFLTACAQTHPSLARLAHNPEPAVEMLMSGSRTLVHADYSPNNILVSRAHEVLPIDWESAAMGPAAVDLASLTEGWSDHVVDRCIRSYLAAKPDAGPREHLERLVAAGRIYHLLRVSQLDANAASTVKGRRRAAILAGVWEAL